MNNRNVPTVGRRSLIAVAAALALATGLPTEAPAQLPQPLEYQMGVGGGGGFMTVGGRNGVLLAASDVAGIFRSLDGGRSWRLANNVRDDEDPAAREPGMASIKVNDILWHPTIEHRVIIATMEGIYTSDDAHLPGGPTWTRRTPGRDPSLGLYGGFMRGGEYPPDSGCVNTLKRNSRQGSVAALAAYVDEWGQTYLFGVSGLTFFDSSPQRDTNRDLLWVSTDGGENWTYHRIRLPAPAEAPCNWGPILNDPASAVDPPCSLDAFWNDPIYETPECPPPANLQQLDWRRTFSDVEALEGRVFVAALEGQGVFSAPLSDLDDWRRENAGLSAGCHGGVGGYHPSKLTRFDPDGEGPDPAQLLLSVLTTSASGPTGECVGGPTSWGVYRWDPDLAGAPSRPHWDDADAEAASPLPPPVATVPYYYSYIALKSFQTAGQGRVFAAMPNGSDFYANRGAIYRSDDGANWYEVAPGYWRDREPEVNACGTDVIYRQLGIDWGPYEFGLHRYLCLDGAILEHYPNPWYHFSTADTYTPGATPPARDSAFYISESWGFHQLDPDYDPSRAGSPPARPATPLAYREISEDCPVSATRDFNDNALKCWEDASIVGLPDIACTFDVEPFDGWLWYGRADYSGTQWRFDLSRRHWEEILMPMHYTYVRDITRHDNYDPDMGHEIFAIAARPGDPAAALEPCGQDLIYPMLILGAGEIGWNDFTGGIIRGVKCGGEWRFEAVGMVDEAPNGDHPNWNKVCPRKIAGFTPRDDFWDACEGTVVDLAYMPPRPDDGTEGRGRFLAVVAGQRYDPDAIPPGARGELGVYSSTDGLTWLKLPPDTAAGWPDWSDEDHCTQAACVGSGGWDFIPFAFSQLGGELFLSFRGTSFFELPLDRVSGIWRWRTDALRPGGGVFERVRMDVPLMGIAAVARDANGALLVATGTFYHPSVPGNTPPYSGQTHRAGVYRCEGPPGLTPDLPDCRSWTTLVHAPDWSFENLMEDEYFFYGFSGGLVVADELGGRPGPFYVAAWGSNTDRSSGGVPMAVSEDGGLTWSLRDLSRGYRAVTRLRTLVLGGQTHLALLGCAGIQVLDFDCADADRDGYGSAEGASCPAGDSVDCDDSNAAIWATPGEVRDIRFDADRETLRWELPRAAGAWPESLLYDTLRAGSPGGFLSADCIESDDGSDRSAHDNETPSPGGAFYYLVRASNGCPAGEGSLGTDSSGTPRAGRACP